MADRPMCNWKLDADGHADVRVLFDGADCTFPPGFKGWVSSVAEVAPTKTETASPTPRVRATVPRRPVHRVKETHMDEQIPQPTPVAAPQTASVGVPAVPSAADLSKIAADAGGGSAGLLMAALAVLGGGGAIWKFLNGRNKQKHEERMKELELQADNQKRDDDKDKQCESRTSVVALRIDSLEPKVTKLVDDVASLQFSLRDVQSRLAEIQGKLNQIKWPDSDFDSDEFESRMAAVEKKLKAKK